MLVPSAPSEPVLLGAASPSRLDLQEHLVLIGHVVQELSLRVPTHLDRTAMFAHGAMGLLVAARRHDEATGDFSRQAMRAIRATIIGNLSTAAPTPSDEELASLLGVPVLAFRSARAASTNAAPVVRRTIAEPSRPVRLTPPTPAFMGA